MLEGFSPRAQARLLAQVGAQVTGILDTTRQMVRDEVQRGLEAGLGGGALGDSLEDAAAFSEYRGELIARTETAIFLNRAATETYRDYGVTHVTVIDGEGDPECAEANGQTWTLEEADANPIAHPNCVRDFAPIVGEVPEQAAPEEAPTEAERGAAELGQGVDKFENAGGTVDTTQGYAGSREAKAQFADMAGRMPEGWANEPGPHATNAVFNTVSSTTEYHVAYDADGALAGAMRISDPGGIHPDSIYIDLIGSTGIVPGAGSALVQEAIREAADQGVGISLIPLTDAKPFWTRMGLGEGNVPASEGGGWGATAAQVALMAAKLGLP